MPESIGRRLLPAGERYALTDVPASITPPEGAVRLYIGPANFAGQGFAWARAAERLAGVAAANMQYRGENDFGFPADYAVPERVYRSSRRWSEGQLAAVSAGFTHALIEAGRPLFGGPIRDIEDEAYLLRSRGVEVGLICHGTDIRRPSRHVLRDEWSPFRDAPPDWIATLESRAARNLELIERIGAPAFVSTPELLVDLPQATWLPLVVDTARWTTAAPVLERSRPVVLHAPTDPLVKGTHLVEPVAEMLSDAGAIQYRRIVKVPSTEMPGLYAGADVVLEQFALGMYSVTAVEAMAAGRLVVGHIHQQVRAHVRAMTGEDLPIVDATPATLESVLRDITARPAHYREIALRGPRFVHSTHDGRHSAQVLAPFLGVVGR